MLDTASAWLDTHRLLLGLVGTGSVLLLAVTILLTPWLVAQLPANYFSTARAPLASRGLRRVLLLLLRNTTGIVFMALGLIMMVTPGPGIIALVVGLSLCEFPGKHTILTRLAGHPSVFRSLNWLRDRSGSPPFESPTRR